MFLFWLRTYPTATWQDLVDALKAPGVELYNVAAMVETNFTIHLSASQNSGSYVASYIATYISVYNMMHNLQILIS